MVQQQYLLVNIKVLWANAYILFLTPVNLLLLPIKKAGQAGCFNWWAI